MISQLLIKISKDKGGAYLSRDTVQVQLHHVLATGIELRVSITILRIDDALKKTPFENWSK